MAELLPPPTPADADLTDFKFMPLEIGRLQKSKSWLICKRRPELAFYMVNLWTAAWHETPAGSLEDDDDLLADKAKCDPTKWEKVKGDVMRNWKKYADGRLYHEVVSEKVNEAWLEKAVYRWKKECDRIRKENKHRMENNEAMLEFPAKPVWNSETHRIEFQRTEKGIPAENALKGKGKGKGEGEGEGESTSTIPLENHSTGKPAPAQVVAVSRLDQDTPNRRVMDRFLALRDELWPTESRLPAPGLTLLQHADVALDGKPELEGLVLEVLEREMRKAAAKGDTAPHSTKAYGLSIANAARRHAEQIKSGGEAASPTKALVDPELLAKQRNRNVERFKDGAQWQAAFGPSPIEPGCLADPDVLRRHGFEPIPVQP